MDHLDIKKSRKLSSLSLIFNIAKKEAHLNMKPFHSL